MDYGRLTEKKVRYIVRHKRRGKSNREIAFEMRVSVSTVKRVWSCWLTQGEYLPIRKRGRKVKELSEEEKEIVREAKMKYKLGARRLEKVIEQVYGIYIPHNRIHKYLLEEGLAKEEPRKKRRRKPYIRYEREHSMSAGHIDWFEKDGIKFCAIIDDASRKILAAGEFQNANTENSIALVDKLVEDYWDIMPLEELISDNGSEFGAHRKGDRKEWESRFKSHLDSLGIKLITSRIKHPQTNGKIEKLFDCYNRYRDDFEILDDFVYWYNNVRFHESLDTKHHLQTPEDAFWGRLPVEARLGVAFKLFDEVVGNER
ncbi:Integrase core domain protein [Candidatus Methanoperedenaceae archaeon GB37]|nr:Integrase core domain protein [Candidatus Methanoperedenaceae archaeon GB37]